MEISVDHEKKDISISEILTENSQEENSENLSETIETLNTNKLESELNSDKPNQDSTNKTEIPDQEGLNEQIKEVLNLDSTNIKEITENTDESEILIEEKYIDPVFDGTEISETENQAGSSVWPEKAAALKNYVKEKGTVAVSTVLRRLSGKKEEGEEEGSPRNFETNEGPKEEEFESKESAQKEEESEPKESSKISVWNPLSFIKIGKTEEQKLEEKSADVPVLKGRIVIYTKLGCQECKTVRNFMREKKLNFTEINIDVFPSRKLELEKKNESYTIPVIYFNSVLIGGLKELTDLEQSNLLDEKISEILSEVLEASAPSPPLPGEDDESASGKIDELAIIVRKMKETVIPKDRFYKMRRFSNCFLGSQVVDFLSEDQYLDKPEAVEFGQKLADHLFFKHVLDENKFEDSNQLYRFLEHDPIISSQCHNIPRGTLDVLPKPVVEIAARLRVLSQAISEAYVSDDGRKVDYKSVQASEEFKRYVRITEELQRVTLHDLPREEKLSFFINLYNMMAIHAILSLGHPTQPLERRRFYGDFKYVIGGEAYSLSAIHNGVLRGNQRPPYSLTKPFGPKDKRTKSVVLPHPEPLVHFALVSGTKSGPALRCYSPGNIDKELMDAARDFMRNGGLTFDADVKVASASRILSWYSADFGKNEIEVIKHAANYLEPVKKEELMELLANTQLKVNYQPYDWSLNV
ncbi:hypothetical protein LUZ60_000965 [Juncus effusus]|nr:hypothetical protein LUZ60_000965 [Juncus effusus]